MQVKITKEGTAHVERASVPEVCDDGLRYVGKCDCGAEVAENYLPTGDIYVID